MTAVNGVFRYEDRIYGHVHLAQEWFRGYVVVSAVLPPRICGDLSSIDQHIFWPTIFFTPPGPLVLATSCSNIHGVNVLSRGVLRVASAGPGYAVYGQHESCTPQGMTKVWPIEGYEVD